MKKYLFLTSAVVILSAVMAYAVPRSAKSTTAAAAPVVQAKAFLSVYSDQAARENHFIPSGWMGDYGDLKINTGWTDNPQSGKSCIKVTYNAKGAQMAGFGGIYWQYPANNWGDKKGLNLVGAKKLTFWARGGKGGEKITEFKVGGITGNISDTDAASLGPIELTKEWKQYTIDLTGKDLSNIAGGFAFSASKDDNPDGFEIFFDNIQYE